MTHFPKALSHGSIIELFPDIYFITGRMETVLQDKDWAFSRNMTIIRDGERLILINSVRLDDNGLAELDKLGQVTDVICLGSLHGRDDAFYIDRYQANYWTMAGMPLSEGIETKQLSVDSELPISNATLFEFQTTQIPEAIIHLNRDGGVLIACDALQNWTQADEYFSEESKQMMQAMGFFKPANIGPVWMQVATPSAEDFIRLKTMTFKHAICGHGSPLLNTAYEDYSATFKQYFSI